MYFAWGLPLFAGERPQASELDAKDIQNFLTLNQCMPTMEIDVPQYHVSATYHMGKLLLIAALNPRAIEWIFLAAILVQRGLSQRVTQLLLDRKDRFLEIMHKDLASQSETGGIDPSIISYAATLKRMVVNVVGSLKSLNLGQLGEELSLEGALPDTLDFDHYVTGDKTIWSLVTEARALGFHFHDEPLLIEVTDSEHSKEAKRPWLDRDTLQISKDIAIGRWKRIEILRTTPGSTRFTTVNMGPTGRVSHAKLVAGLLQLLLSKTLPPGQREQLRKALEQPCIVHFTLEVDLHTGIGEILVNDTSTKGYLECPSLNIETDLPKPANITRIDNLLAIAPIKDLAFLDFSSIVNPTAANWDQIVLTYLVLKGWWWAKHLILDFPTLLFVPNQNAYFRAMAGIGATMLQLEQNSGCAVTTNALFDSLRFLTDLGGVHDLMTHEAVVYAAQGPGGTLVHDILGHHSEVSWSENPYLTYRWLHGKFLGVPEVAMFSQGATWRKPSSKDYSSIDLEKEENKDITVSVTIFADSTDGHTLSCAIVNEKRKIRVLPFSRVLAGVMLAYIGCEPSCGHSREDGQTFVEGGGIRSLPWSIISFEYFGDAEVREEDSVLVVGIQGSRLCQMMALAVTQACTAIDTRGCLVCAFTRSGHVIQTPWLVDVPEPLMSPNLSATSAGQSHSNSVAHR